MIKVEFPHIIDSSMLSALRSCPHKMFRMYMQHWKRDYESVDLIAGGAFAHALEATRTAYYIDKIDKEEAIALGLVALVEKYGDYEPVTDTPKTLERMLGAFEYFNECFDLDDDTFQPVQIGDKHGIEFSFAEPIDFIHPVTRRPILFVGRADMLGHYLNGYYLEDDKTTKSLGANWANQWELRSQFSGYVWAARKCLNLNVKGMVVRGVSILKTKYDHQQCITHRADWEINRWYDQLIRDLHRLQEMWEEGYFDYNLDYACNEYGGCTFRDICKSSRPEEFLKQDFIKKVWNPIERTEMTIEQWNEYWK